MVKTKLTIGELEKTCAVSERKKAGLTIKEGSKKYTRHHFLGMQYCAVNEYLLGITSIQSSLYTL